MTERLGTASGRTSRVAVPTWLRQIVSPGRTWVAVTVLVLLVLAGPATSMRSPTVAATVACPFVSMSAGRFYSLALRADGTVWVWGSNEYGQLTRPHKPYVRDYSAVPVRAQGIERAVAASAGSYHNLVLTSDGKVWAWGGNQSGQLGDGTTTQRHYPVQVQGLPDVVEVAAGRSMSYAIAADGSLWAWGSGGRIGDGTRESRHSPVRISGIAEVVAVSSGAGHTLALTSDGSLWAWGENYRGQLGDGTTTHRLTPVRVRGLEARVVALSAGSDISLAATSDGKAWAWGFNENGYLGDGTATDRHTPVRVRGIEGSVVTIATEGEAHSYAVTSDGTLWAWGANPDGYLGDGTTNDHKTPTRLQGVSGVAAVDTHLANTFVLTSDETAWAWGSNILGSVGDGTTTDRHTPVRVLEPSSDCEPPAPTAAAPASPPPPPSQAEDLLLEMGPRGEVAPPHGGPPPPPPAQPPPPGPAAQAISVSPAQASAAAQSVQATYQAGGQVASQGAASPSAVGVGSDAAEDQPALSFSASPVVRRTDPATARLGLGVLATTAMALVAFALVARREEDELCTVSLRAGGEG